MECLHEKLYGIEIFVAVKLRDGTSSIVGTISLLETNKVVTLLVYNLT